MNIPEEYKKKFYGLVLVLLGVLCVYFAVGIFKNGNYSNGQADAIKNTITVSGKGEVSATPDIASVYFTLRGEAKTVADAQKKVAEQEVKALKALKENDIEDKDIKTTGASFGPKYEYVEGARLCDEYGCYPRPGKSVIVGYEAYETITAKIRNIDSTGKVMEDLGLAGISQLNGPDFTIDEEKELKDESRRLAIIDAKEKAEVLAKDLGVRLKGVVSFNESGNSFYPQLYTSSSMDYGMVKEEASVRAQLPQGENTITTNVTITYEIR
ncbi:MAG: SIMPL domain-containing protein [Candidatus Paceibacterota bacterium]|jgi:hypothetical protein